MFLLRIGQKLIFPLMIIVCILLILLLQLGFIFLLIALLPSIAAYFVDEDSDLASFRTIFACNLAATLPILTPMFISGLKMKHYNVGSIIGNPSIWLFIYSGAAIGWVMIYFSKHVARAILDIQYKLRTASLERSQVRISEEWGDSIKALPEEDSVKDKT
ncbi:MAG: hypothetical protein ABL857_04940 [Rickettsiales bacterium]|jgi:hypothetical protein